MPDVAHRPPNRRVRGGWYSTANQDRDFTPDEIQFMKAMDQYKRDNRRPHPTWGEVLEVARALGYRKQEG